MKRIPHSRPWITDADVRAVSETLRGGMVGQGELTARLEREIAAWVGVEVPGVAVASGSAAIALSLRALGCGAGDDILTPSYVCRDVLAAVVSCGATPVLCDAGPDWIMTAESIAPRLTPRSRAIIAPHLYGIFADVASMRPFGLPIVEDAAQAVDGQARRPLKGDIGIFSFHPTKCLTAGEGGMAVTRDAELADRMRGLRDGRPGAPLPRMFTPLSDVAAALCLSQLERYEESLKRRREIAGAYVATLAPILGPDFTAAVRSLEGRTMYFRFPVRVPRPGLDLFAADFLEAGITVRRGVDELLHRLLGLADDRFKESVRHFETTLSLPIYPALSDEDRDRVAATAARLLERAGPAAAVGA